MMCLNSTKKKKQKCNWTTDSIVRSTLYLLVYRKPKDDLFANDKNDCKILASMAQVLYSFQAEHVNLA